MKTRVFGGIVVALMALSLVGCGDGSEEPSPSTQPRPNATATATPANELAVALEGLPAPGELADGMFLGGEDAPLTLVMFEDFVCPHCLEFTALIEPMIVEEYVVTGKVRLEFRNWPILGPASVAAAAAAECAAGQGEFWEYHRRLFLAHPEAGGERDGSGLSPPRLLEYAADLGLDLDEFIACYDSDETIERLQENATAARSAGLTGTPGFLIDGDAFAAPRTLDGWRELLDGRLAGR